MVYRIQFYYLLIMAKPHEKQQAITLRKAGNSISDIAKQLSISKSTVSYWCRDISLSPTQISHLATKSRCNGTASFLKIAEEKRKKRRENEHLAKARGAHRVTSLTTRERFCIGLGLYWGEGYKTGNQEFGFTNSDPDMIKFYLSWLRETFSVEADRLVLRVSINEAHRNRVTEVERYWSQLTDIPQNQFTRISLIKTAHKKQYSNYTNHFGTLRIKVRNGTDLRREILGAISALKD